MILPVSLFVRELFTNAFTIAILLLKVIIQAKEVLNGPDIIWWASVFFLNIMLKPSFNMLNVMKIAQILRTVLLFDLHINNSKQYFALQFDWDFQLRLHKLSNHRNKQCAMTRRLYAQTETILLTIKRALELQR